MTSVTYDNATFHISYAIGDDVYKGFAGYSDMRYSFLNWQPTTEEILSAIKTYECTEVLLDRVDREDLVVLAVMIPGLLRDPFEFHLFPKKVWSKW